MIKELRLFGLQNEDWPELTSVKGYQQISDKWQSTPVLLPGESHGQRSLVGYCSWGHKELDTTERLHYLSIYLYTIEGASLVAQW